MGLLEWLGSFFARSVNTPTLWGEPGKKKTVRPPKGDPSDILSSILATMVFEKEGNLYAEVKEHGNTYAVANISGEMAIVCLRCRMASYSPGDIENLYCGKCKAFHEREKST